MNELSLLPFAFDGPEVRAIVTARTGGVSTGPYESLNLGDHVGDDPEAVRVNRDRPAAALHVDRLTVPDQQHTSNVAVVTAESVGQGHSGAAEARATFGAVDGLVTDVPGAALTIMVADCTPVVLWDPRRRAIGAAHCGRAGLLSGVLPTTIELMRSTYGTDPADLWAGVGPGICRASYEVGDTEAEQTERVFPGIGLTQPTRPGHHLLDVPAGVLHQLSAAGLRAERVDHLDHDTLTDDRFFSHRAADPPPSGRFMAVVALPAR